MQERRITKEDIEDWPALIYPEMKCWAEIEMQPFDMKEALDWKGLYIMMFPTNRIFVSKWNPLSSNFSNAFKGKEKVEFERFYDF